MSGITGAAEIIQAQKPPPKKAPAAKAPPQGPVKALTAEIPDNFFGFSEATNNFKNSFFTGTKGRTERFNYKEPGSGISGIENPAKAFDILFGAPLLSEIAIEGDNADFLTSTTRAGGLISEGIRKGAFADASPEALKAADLNKQLRELQGAADRFLKDPVYLDAFAAAGITPEMLKDKATLDAIAPERKAAVLDMVARAKEAKNQRPKQGIAQSLGGFGGLIGPIIGGLVGGPIGAGLIGAAQSAFQPGGVLNDPFSVIKDTASAAGIGEFISTGNILGKNIIDPIATSGRFPGGTLVGFDKTPGGRLAPSLEPTGVTPPGGLGTPPIPDPPGKRGLGIPDLRPDPGASDRTDSGPPLVPPTFPGSPPAEVPPGTVTRDSDEETPPIFVPPTPDVSDPQVVPTTTTTGPTGASGGFGLDAGSLGLLRRGRAPIFGPSLLEPLVRQSGGDQALRKVAGQFPGMTEILGL